MCLRTMWRATGWVIWDTFQQTRASSAFWLLLGVSFLAIVFCLSIGIVDKGPLYTPDDIEINPHRGQLQIGFGAFTMPLPRDDRSAVLLIQVLLAEWVAGTIGVLLALIWTAGLLPSFLDATTATVLLAKPVPRAILLIGKVLGVVALFSFQMAVFVVGTWVALAIRTQVWEAQYLMCLPLVIAQFFALFSVSALLAVVSRSTVVTIVGVILFWALCYGVNYSYHAIAMDLSGPTTVQVVAINAAYWSLPKPVDTLVIINRVLEANRHFAMTPELHEARISVALTLATSFMFGLAVLAVAIQRFARAQY